MTKEIAMANSLSHITLGNVSAHAATVGNLLFFVHIVALYVAYMQGMAVPVSTAAVFVGILCLALLSVTGLADRAVLRSRTVLYVGLYMWITVCAIMLINVWSAVDIAYSNSRMVIGWTLFSVSLFGYISFLYGSSSTSLESLCKGIACLFAILLVAGVLMPDLWHGMAGIGLRYGGGINPNQLAFISVFGLFFSWFVKCRVGCWRYPTLALACISVIICVMTASRTGILAVVLFLSALGSLRLLDYIRGMYGLKLVKVGLHVLILSSILSIVLYTVGQTPIGDIVYTMAEYRSVNHSTVQTRYGVWQALLEAWRSNVALGGLGYWYSQVYLDGFGMSIASSHSLYVRLLGEVGVIGLVLVVSLPVILMVGLAYIYVYGLRQQREMACLMIAILVALFAMQVVEDRYFASMFALNTYLVNFWVAAGACFVFDPYCRHGWTY